MAIVSDVMKYFDTHQGIIVYLADLVEALGIDENQARIGVNNLRHKDDFYKTHIETVVRGNAWRFCPNNAPKKKADNRQVFEEIGKTKDGSLILESEEGTLYKATEL